MPHSFASAPWDNREILREELFSIERLEQHATTLAQAQLVTDSPVRKIGLDARLLDNEKVLLLAYRSIADAVDKGLSVTPAAEWLLDNYHLVDEQIREIREDLPPGFYRQLPKLATGPLIGYPRVLGIAWAFVAHSDSRFDPEPLRRMVRAYQRVQPLTIGELWAIAITLRIVLVENLRRASQHIVENRAAREEADAIADRLLGVNRQPLDPDALQKRYQRAPVLEQAFVVQLVKRLRDQDPSATPALRWLDAHLAKQEISLSDIVRNEHNRQSASNVTVRNIITSMRRISDVDWSEFFETVSLVDELLRANGPFDSNDFATRDLYRRAIEVLARCSSLTELEVTQQAIDAGAAAQRDPGHFLIADGRRAFQTQIGYRPSAGARIRGLARQLGAGGYICASVLTAIALLALPLWLVRHWEIGAAHLLCLALLGLLPAMNAAVALVNRAIASIFAATILPGLALREGIPEQARTLVVIPTMLTSTADVDELLERLEVHSLAAGEGAIHFALLTDWEDAANEMLSSDRALFEAATRGIERLNLIHTLDSAGRRFFLFHRRRTWNAQQNAWMGWERKRGKLHELNHLLRGATDTNFIDLEGHSPLEVPTGVRYVITLDSDTRMPRDAATRLVGKISHPLNRPFFDRQLGRVVSGYGILQPRVTPSLPIGQHTSLFQRVFSSSPGMDPYAAAVSDVYQDLCGEGSYAGKGIYDIDAFESALSGRVPDNTLLSHDLFEGIFARAGLVSDVEVVEEFPSRYAVAALRQHRWTRGDWQLLPWIFGRRGKQRTHSAIPLLGRWKMIDNLRRSLTPPLTVVALLAGWMLGVQAAAWWTAFLLTTIALPALLPLLTDLLPQHAGIKARSHLRWLGKDLRLAEAQIVLQIVFLADVAGSLLDAITRTLYRLCISHRRLLEWTTAAQVQRNVRLRLSAAYRQMWFGILISAACVALLIASAPSQVHWLAAPLVIAWLLAPAIATWISRSPSIDQPRDLSERDTLLLRNVARSTWRFFETFVTAEQHMLPPDNFQEEPQPVVATRTSPTNMGLYLLSIVAARDFGWIGTADAVQRLEDTLGTMSQLQRYRGHFYNWYDTKDLRPLEPRYVSSVDSGNLAAHLIALANAAREWITVPVVAEERLAGVADAVSLALIALRGLPQDVLARHAQDVQALERFSTDIRNTNPGTVSLAQWLPQRIAQLDSQFDSLSASSSSPATENEQRALSDVAYWHGAVRRSLQQWHEDATRVRNEQWSLIQRLNVIAARARAMANAMDFHFLIDAERRLLAIGWREADGTLDPNCYDLLASEARLASFYAIAKGDAPARHWFRLGRAATPIGNGVALISWSGSMFEYLMPSLVMRAPVGSLLEQTNRLIVQRQISYGTSVAGPWGISESAYNARDLEMTYQYSNFGVPGLGLKRGLSENVVIAPYATALAAMVDPAAAAHNFETLTAVGARGAYGFYEALDYTPSRLADGVKLAVVRAFMAHHQGMSIVAIANVIHRGIMRERFHNEPSVQATELLLQERSPRNVAVAHPRAEEVTIAPRTDETLNAPAVRRIFTAHDATPQTHLLSNGSYSVMLSAAGSGYSRWRGLAITRWRADTTLDDTGSYVLLREIANDAAWSCGYQPSAVEPDAYEVTFTEDRAQISRSDHSWLTAQEVLVSPEDDAEVRRVSITNQGSYTREIEVTTYAELALATPAADDAHPAFSKLFVQTEHIAAIDALLATRRKRSPSDHDIWAGHHAVVEGEVVGLCEFETDRAAFLGRRNTSRQPAALSNVQPLKGTVGPVLDPIFSLRYRVRVRAGATARLSFWTVAAETREGVLDLIDKHRDVNAFARAGTLSWTQAQIQLRHLSVSAEEASLFQRLAGHLLYPNAALRSPATIIARGSGGAPALWAQGISGDLPILLLRINDVEDLPVARQIFRAHDYWRTKQLAIDLVILNERGSSYVQELQIALETLLRSSQSRPALGHPAAGGSVYLLRADLISPQTNAVLLAVARVVLVSQRGSVQQQLDRTVLPAASARPPTPSRSHEASTAKPAATAQPQLEFSNGLGGFAEDGREYVIRTSTEAFTPAPWINVVSNPQFGFQVSAEGAGFTWSVNSRENQLTAWSNDPVCDPSGDAFYIRDADSGELWCPTAAPIAMPGAIYTARHAQGFSRFQHEAHGIALDLLMFVPLHDPLKISRLVIRNTGQHTRRLSVTSYIEWVLGTSRVATAPFIVTEMDPVTGAVFAHNTWTTVYASRIAFADLRGRQTQWTTDRTEFLGRHGSLSAPAALMHDTPLARRVGAGLDPCSALQTAVEIAPGAQIELVCFLGQAGSRGEAQELIKRYRAADLDAALKEVTQHWDDLLGTIQIRTPDRAFDVALNRWMLYQALACRVWARSGFYQASGAYGFRDQLQDGMALVTAAPHLTREHLLRAAARQFTAGDVQHWWLPPTGQGVRTRISDDRAWLAYTTAHYVDSTQDVAILDESVPFLEGQKLQPGEHDAYFLPSIAYESASLFEHCARALDESLTTGERGLPLIGTGDWNDGMNRVGEQGKGESVWLGWLLCTTLTRFAALAQTRGETVRAKRWTDHVTALQQALETKGWDGDWYRRGYFDDGAPLGSATSDECQIDSIAQSWRVLSGIASDERAERAMTAVQRRLIRPDDALAMLFTPPFDHTPMDPGYIKGYPPGIRENGGQYTHAATWSVIALAMLGDGNGAFELFSILNPVNRGATSERTQRYRVEPYVVAADVYSMPPHVGRGGWTWYTGSAGWMYQAGIHWIAGLRLQGTHLLIDPCIPREWPGFDATLKWKSSRYEIHVENPRGVSRGIERLECDSIELSASPPLIPLTDDGNTHHVQVVLGGAGQRSA